MYKIWNGYCTLHAFVWTNTIYTVCLDKIWNSFHALVWTNTTYIVCVLLVANLSMIVVMVLYRYIPVETSFSRVLSKISQTMTMLTEGSTFKCLTVPM